MQIHELNNFSGTLGSGAYLAIDDGNDTGKISSQGLLAATEARIDNIIAGPAPSAEEIVDARLGDDGVTYPSLGDAIRDQFSDVKSDLTNEILNASEISNSFSSTAQWIAKYISPTTGLYTASTDTISLISSVYLENTTRIKAKSGYVFRLYAYQLDGTYVGAWDGTQFAKSWGFKTLTDFSTIKYPSYKFKISIRKADDSTITISECTNAVIYTDGIIAINETISDLRANKNPLTQSDWRVGYVNPTSGANATSTTSISFKDTVFLSTKGGLRSVDADTGYHVRVFAYQLDGTFVGCWDGSAFSKSWDYIGLKHFDVSAYPNYKFRFDIYREDGATMTTAEYTNVSFTFDTVSLANNDIDALDTKLSFYDDLLHYTPFDIAELGSINASPAPDEPWWVNSTSRIRTMRDHLIPLSVGDKITLTDYSAVTMWLVWEKSNGTWGSSGTWLYADYTVSEAGGYALLVRNVTEATVSDINDLAKYIVIEKKTSIYNDVYADIEKNQRRNWFTKSINHRGFGRTAPENTLPAFRLSAKYGWEYVETDVRFTSDGVAVLLHDTSINRTARNADGTEIGTTVNIADITYEDALDYDFGIWMGEQYEGTPIPTLEEFLTLCKKLSLHAYLELKNYSDSDAEYIVDMVNRCGMKGHVSYICFSEAGIRAVLACDASARVGILGDLSNEMITAAQTYKTAINDVFLDVSTSSLTTSLINATANVSIPLEVYTPNSAETIDALDVYISGVTSDYRVAGKDLYELNIK